MYAARLVNNDQLYEYRLWTENLVYTPVQWPVYVSADNTEFNAQVPAASSYCEETVFI